MMFGTAKQRLVGWRLLASDPASRAAASYALAAVRFALRCAGSAALAYFAAKALGLPKPVWAPVSALIVSQETFQATRGSVQGRITGTLHGAVLALGTYLAGGWLDIPVIGQLAIMVGLAGFVAKEKPPLRACLWTGPIILLTAGPSVTIEAAVLYRTSEVILGALSGVLLHWIENTVVTAFKRHVATLGAGPGIGCVSAEQGGAG
jgi:uncharacterized membrane protein YccC